MRQAGLTITGAADLMAYCCILAFLWAALSYVGGEVFMFVQSIREMQRDFKSFKASCTTAFAELKQDIRHLKASVAKLEARTSFLRWLDPAR